MSDRIFSEHEVQRLIRRAAELEAERSVTGRDSGKNGLTMDELKTVASEAGLDPHLIEKAALEMSNPSSENKEPVRINREEITSETWIDAKPDRETMNLLVTELNHIYGTTDELNWWDNLWGTHEGKAKVTRTSTSTEWNYKTQAGMFSTRVLMQRRGDRFRIRVSKRQIMDLKWDNALNYLVILIPLAVIFAVIGGITSSNLFGVSWLGITAGMLVSMAGYPLVKSFINRSIDKHKAEVAITMRQLSDLILQSSIDSRKNDKTSEKSPSASAIEINEEPQAAETDTGRLRNNLRE
jgi:hypothetical protein